MQAKDKGDDGGEDKEARTKSLSANEVTRTRMWRRRRPEQGVEEEDEELKTEERASETKTRSEG